MIEENEAFTVLKDDVLSVARLFRKTLSRLNTECPFPRDYRKNLSELSGIVIDLEGSLAEAIDWDGSCKATEHLASMIAAISQWAIMEIDDESQSVKDKVNKYNKMTEKMLNKACSVYKIISNGTEIQLPRERFTVEEQAIGEHLQMFRDVVAKHCDEGIRSMAPLIAGGGYD